MADKERINLEQISDKFRKLKKEEAEQFFPD